MKVITSSCLQTVSHYIIFSFRIPVDVTEIGSAMSHSLSGSQLHVLDHTFAMYNTPGRRLSLSVAHS